MRKILSLLLRFHCIALWVILMNHIAFAQSPYRMSYQAVIRNASNNLVSASPVKMKITILQGSSSGKELYTESHSLTTNDNGLATLEIGGGANSSGNFDEINWENGPYFIRTETDPKGGDNYSITSTAQLLSVPFSLFSNEVPVSVSRVGDTLTIGRAKKILIPGISILNYFGIGTTGITEHLCGAKNVHNSSLSYSKMTDQEGNQYRTIMIGSQVWMAENLRTTKYRNGTSITNITTDNTQWLNNTAGAYCNYKNILTNDCPYGKLYNWYAVSNSNQLCPNGWHVPSDSEWTTLTNFLGGETVAGVKAKSAGTQFWLAPNTDATNDSGLSALPGGYRGNAGAFAYEGYYGYWWSASENLAEGAFSRRLDYNNTILKRENYVKATGFSVRCVKD